jgi:hypothetical protein
MIPIRVLFCRNYHRRSSLAYPACEGYHLRGLSPQRVEYTAALTNPVRERWKVHRASGIRGVFEAALSLQCVLGMEFDILIV